MSLSGPWQTSTAALPQELDAVAAAGPARSTIGTDTISCAEPAVSTANSLLKGKRVGMVTFSPYPDDPRPRRAVDALLDEGMHVDLLCLANGKVQNHEIHDRL